MLLQILRCVAYRWSLGVLKENFMLKSAELSRIFSGSEMIKMPTIVGILTFMSRKRHSRLIWA